MRRSGTSSGRGLGLLNDYERVLHHVSEGQLDSARLYLPSSKTKKRDELLERLARHLHHLEMSAYGSDRELGRALREVLTDFKIEIPVRARR